MSIKLFAYMDTAPSLEEMRSTLAPLGLVYRHTLPADDRWEYPMHVFGRTDLRVVYHAGDPQRGGCAVYKRLTALRIAGVIDDAQISAVRRL